MFGIIWGQNITTESPRDQSAWKNKEGGTVEIYATLFLFFYGFVRSVGGGNSDLS